jgi:hypothetical protein
MIATLFTTDVVYGGLLSTAIGGGTAAGQFGGSLIATPGGHMKWKLIIVTACLTAFVGGMAGAKQNQAVASALITLGSASLGAIEALAIGVVTIVIDDQKEMGVASGVFSSLRSVGGVIASKFNIVKFELQRILMLLYSCHLRGDPHQRSLTKHGKRRRACSDKRRTSSQLSRRTPYSPHFRQLECNIRSSGCYESDPCSCRNDTETGLL